MQQALCNEASLTLRTRPSDIKDEEVYFTFNTMPIIEPVCTYDSARILEIDMP
jgi:hypothetical protein